MEIRLFSNLFVLVSLLLILFLQPNTIFACASDFPSPCVAYSRANAVFIGKLQKLEEVEEATLAHFEVEKVFKGKVSKLEIIKFIIGNCGRTFRVGEKYFVYKEHSNYDSSCNRTHPLSETSSDYMYINSLSEKNPIFTTGAVIRGLTEDEVRNVKVTIENKQRKYEPSINENGRFRLKITNTGTYTVKIEFPFKAIVEVTSGDIGYDIESFDSENKTTILYKVEFKANSCDEREINFDKTM